MRLRSQEIIILLSKKTKKAYINNKSQGRLEVDGDIKSRLQSPVSKDEPKGELTTNGRLRLSEKRESATD